MGLLIVAVAIVVLLIVAVLPSIIAFRGQHPNRWVILVINVALGGTVIGWLGALIWALNRVHLSPSGSNGGESGLNIFANDEVRVRTIEPPIRVTPPREEPNAGEELVRLKRLFDSGVLTATEYQMLRKPLLEQLGL